MHLLLIHQAFTSLDEPGGTRHYEMARFLVAHGHRVTVIASPVSYLTGSVRGKRSVEHVEPNRHPGLTIHYALTYPGLHRSFVHRVFSFLSFMFSSFIIGMRVKGVDLVWGTSPPIFQGVTAWALARLKGARFLLEVRDLWPAFAIAVGVLRNPLLIRLSEGLERFLYKYADRVLVNSPGFVSHVESRGASNVAIVTNGADVDMFDPAVDANDFRNVHHLEGKFVALYAGAHGMSNDLGVVLEAADLLRSQTEISIVLLGDGKEKPALVAQARAKDLPNVHFLPPVPKAQMPAALAAADACIAILKPVELYKTVYPNKVFDYMAAGRPVILAMDGVIREVVEGAGAGIAVPPGDPIALAGAIRQLCEGRDTARQMGLAGRRCVEKDFDRRLLAEKLAGILESL